ncbi:MAG TPA: alpha/beta hydrolase [Casimicrobiaceae bacterium]|jgi:arylformamidase|nr:alpha/beta hydrolase [Casimicrobiaceae bacterium]
MLSADFVEREYNLRQAFPDHPQWFARWSAESAAARSRLDSRLGIRYGSGPKQTLDLFPAESPRGALLFIHGGYWRALDKDDHSFVAPAFVDEGVGVVVINYDLCPNVSIAHIVEECRQAVAWLWREGQSQGVPVERLFIAGHSAGGHLVAMLYTTDWRRYGVPVDAIRGGLSISGVFDLEPLIQVSFNADLKLDSGKARALSPIHCTSEVRAPLLLAVGSGETSEFSRQSWLLWERWPECRPAAAHSPLFIAGRHHYSVMSELGDRTSELTAATLEMLLA